MEEKGTFSFISCFPPKFTQLFGYLEFGSLFQFKYISQFSHGQGRCPHGVMVKALDWGIVVSEFVFQSQLLHSLSGKYPWERYEPPYPSSYGLNRTTTVLLGKCVRH